MSSLHPELPLESSKSRRFGGSAPTSPRERAARWALWRIEGVGSKRLARLIEETEGQVAAMFEDGHLAARITRDLKLTGGILDALSACLVGEPEEMYARELEKLGPDTSLVALGDAGYPPALLDLVDPPHFLYLDGDPSVLWMPRRVALVGSRQVPSRHQIFATRLAGELASAGCMIVSGGALGMDAAAHRGALSVGGLTCVVLPGGLGRATPSSHRALFAQVVEEGGVLVTEYPHDVAARRYHFPRRNRLIAALSQGALILKARRAGGTMLTASACKALGRPMAALPYDADDADAAGSHSLIASGDAALAVDASGVIAHCLGELEAASSSAEVEAMEEKEVDEVDASSVARDPSSAAVLACVEGAPRHGVDVDTICEATGMSVGMISASLIELELEGVIWRVPGAASYRSGRGGRY